MRIYAIGDIHGQLEMLREAHDRIALDRARTGDQTAPVVHLGDLVDRGPDSRGVIEFLMDGVAAGAPWVVIKGNHDQIFASQFDEFPVSPLSSWCSGSMGGSETLQSYGISPPIWPSGPRIRRAMADNVPVAHREFIEHLPLFHETTEILFVHAGIRPGLDLYDQIEEDPLWIRREFLEDPRDHGTLVVHGHTPVREPEHHGNRINLDTGAGYGRPLTAAVFEHRKCSILEPEGRRPLEPGTV